MRPLWSRFALVSPIRLVIFNSYPFPFGYSVSKRSLCGNDFGWLAGLLMLPFTYNITERKGYELKVTERVGDSRRREQIG
jgi:hypothetical protein